jgi:hypothetical protein
MVEFSFRTAVSDIYLTGLLVEVNERDSRCAAQLHVWRRKGLIHRLKSPGLHRRVAIRDGPGGMIGIVPR